MIRLIVFSLLLVTLTSCSDGLDKELDIVPFKESGIVSTSRIDENSNKNEKIEVNSEPTAPVYGDYLSGPPMDWFSKIIKDNPIDKDYEKENSELQNSTGFNTTAWIELEDKFSRTWDNELNHIYEQLLNKLNSENKESLIKAQRGWLQYHTNEIEFAEHSINFLMRKDHY